MRGDTLNISSILCNFYLFRMKNANKMVRQAKKMRSPEII
jgi:hypothetical protein